jgi:hypothetical protein
MTDKSKFRENLDSLSEEQFAAVKADIAAAEATRGNPAEYARRVAGMSPREIEQEWLKYR